MNKIKYIAIIFLSLLLNSNQLLSQNEYSADTLLFSLKDLQKYALENNYDLKNSSLDVENAKMQKWETTTMGLPTISGSMKYQNYPDIPTQLMPNFITPAVVGINRGLFGLVPLFEVPKSEKMPVKFGSEHNANWGVSASQLIFSGEYFVGLKASKIYLELSKTSLLKKEEDVLEAVTKTYYLILISQESIKSIEALCKSLAKLKTETEVLAEAGFASKTDARQIELNIKNTENSISTLKQQQLILYQMLKYQAGIDYEQNIGITSNLDSIKEEVQNIGILSENYDVFKDNGYKILQVSEHLAELDLQREKTTVLPKVSAFFNYNKNTMQDEFDLFSDEAKWYPTTVWGINVNIPIFSSGKRWARIQQKKIQHQKSTNTKEQTRIAMQLDFEKTRSDYTSNLNKFINSEESKKLSKDLYDNAILKYKTGTISGLELTQSQNQYFTAVIQYYKDLSNLIDLHVKLKRMLNKN